MNGGRIGTPHFMSPEVGPVIMIIYDNDDYDGGYVYADDLYIIVMIMPM